MACILITDVPIVKALEDQDSQDFEALWDILKTGAIRGYITPNDLQQLNQYLYDSVGADLAQSLLAGFRSVLGIYGEPDHPAIDLIIDGESVDELADEIPIRSVSDFLCIYELECLLAASPGEEVGAEFLFSSLSDMIEVLDGDDAFVSKALMDAIVPVEDAPVLEESPNRPSAGTTRFAITTTSSATPDEDADPKDNSLAKQHKKADQRVGMPPLTPVIQAILNSGNPAGNAKYDLRFASARSDSLAPFSHPVMAPTHGHQSMYDFNVDMFLILGLIMQMTSKDEQGGGKSSRVYQALLTHKSALSPTHRSQNDGETIRPDALHALALLPQSQVHPLFRKQIGDRPFDVEFLDGNRSQKTGNKKKLAPGITSLSASEPLAVSRANPHRMEMSHDPKPYLLEPLTQPSNLLDPNDEFQTIQASSGSPQAPAIALASIPGTSTQMDLMFSDVQQSLTASTGTKRITNNMRSLSSITVSQASVNRLKITLKSVQERTQAASDRLSSLGQHQSTSKRYNAISPSDSGMASVPVQAFLLSSDSGTVPVPVQALVLSSDLGTVTVSVQTFLLSSDSGTVPVPVQTFLFSSDLGTVPVPDQALVLSSDSGAAPVPDQAIPSDVSSAALDLEQSVAPPSDSDAALVTEHDACPLSSLSVEWTQQGTEQDDIVLGSLGADRLVNVEGGHNVIHSYDGADFIKVRNGSNLIWSGPEGDRIVAKDGTHTIYGGEGHDDIVARDGINTIYGGRDNDWILARGGTSTIYGGRDNDSIVARGGTHTIYGGRGEDFIIARDGINTIYGGKGKDGILASKGTHTIYGGRGEDTIETYGATDSHFDGGDGGDVISVSGNGNTIRGGNHADEIHVSDGNHEIDAGKGDDFIVVEAGVSTVTGGRGEDIFSVYRKKDDPDTTSSEADSNHIIITDFEQEKDTIELADIAPDELSVRQVGVNTHIFEGDDLLAVLESVDRDNLLATGAFVDNLRKGKQIFNIFIRWERREIIQEFEQANSLELTGEGQIDPDLGISPEQLSDPWSEEIWIIDVGSDHFTTQPRSIWLIH